jgi:hypothetical protein
MEAHIKENDKKIFYRYLDNATNYLEFGSGGSTFQAAVRPNIKRIVSVESDIEWINKIKEKLSPETKIDFRYIDLKPVPNTWGYPGPTSTVKDKIDYSDVITNLEDSDKLDLVLIDGRFRVACCLKCFSKINDACLIAFDDFLDRPHYHIVLDYYEIVEKTTNNSLVILRKKKGVDNPIDEILRKYELIPE